MPKDKENKGGSHKDRDEGRSNKQSGSSSRSEAGRKGGEAVSKDREHMAEIGRKGGQN